MSEFVTVYHMLVRVTLCYLVFLLIFTQIGSNDSYYQRTFYGSQNALDKTEVIAYHFQKKRRNEGNG